MVKMNFTWIKTRSAWQDLEYQRAKRATYLQNVRDTMSSVNSALSNALQSKVAGIANLAAKAALKRVQAETKAKSDATLAQIDATTKTLDTAKSNIDKIA